MRRDFPVAGQTATQVGDGPVMREAADMQGPPWLNEGFANLVDAAEHDGDAAVHAALAVVDAVDAVDAFMGMAEALPGGVLSRASVLRSTVQRCMAAVLDRVSGFASPGLWQIAFLGRIRDLPGPASFERAWRVQLPTRAPSALGRPEL